MAADMANLKNWRFQIDLEGIAWATIDVQGQSQNTLGREPVEELEAIVTAVEEGARDKRIRGVIFMSGKEKSFIAGADIREFDNLGTEAEVTQVIHAVTGIFDRIETLPVPAVAAIHGFCLGGGLEFSLACHYRIADREEGTRIGLPEVKLGIIPGLNGAARWLRQSGPLLAMPNMLAGRMLRGPQARAAGIVDQLVPTHHELRWAARNAVLRKRKSQRSATYLAPVMMFEAARRYLANRMRKETAAKVREDHYPAPFRLIDLFEKHGGSYESLKREETKTFAPLMVSEQSRNLRRVFRLSEMLKAEAPKAGFKPLRAHVVGAGTMGADIAMVCVAQGMEVSLQDVSAEAVNKALERAKGFFKKRLKKDADAKKAMARLIADPAGAQAHRADVVIEAIFENLEAKQKLFAEIEPKLKAGRGARHQHLVAAHRADRRRAQGPQPAHRPALLQPRRGDAAGRGGARAAEPRGGGAQGRGVRDAHRQIPADREVRAGLPREPRAGALHVRGDEARRRGHAQGEDRRGGPEIRHAHGAGRTGGRGGPRCGFERRQGAGPANARG